MRKIINRYFRGQSFISYNSVNLYIADHTNVSGNKREVECHETKPRAPECFVMVNKSQVKIDFAPFANRVFRDADNNEMEHCECVLFPFHFAKTAWMLFLEIKDCLPRNIGEYDVKSKDQVFNTIRYYRDKTIIEENRVVYGVASFPNCKIIPFPNFTLEHQEIQRIKREKKIIFYATNSVEVSGTDKLSF